MGRKWILIMTRLTALIGSLTPVLLFSIALGVMGFLAAIFLLVAGAYGIFTAAGFAGGWQIHTVLMAAALCAACRGILRYGEQLLGHYMAFKLLAVLRDKVFCALRRLAPAKLANRDKGDLVSMVTSDIELLEVFYAHTVAPAAIAFLVSLIMSLFIGSQHPALGLTAALGYGAIGVLIPWLNARGGKTLGQAYRREYEEAGAYLLESLAGLEEILRFGQGDRRIVQMKTINERMDRLQDRLKIREGVVAGLTEGAILITSGLILTQGLWLFSQGQIMSHQAVICFVAVFSSFGPVVAISALSNNLLQVMAAGERVLNLLDEEPQTCDVTEGREVDHGQAAFHQVSFTYRQRDQEEETWKDVPVLAEADLGVPSRGILGIRGESGSGKSTILKLLMRFWDADSGTVTLAGQDVREINTGCLRQRIGYFTQDTFLFQGTVEDNIKLGRSNAGRGEVEAAAKKAGCHQFIQELPQGYDTEIGQLFRGLSAGECQRIGLAQLFLHGADLLLLDEPTSNLDGFNEAILLKSLKEESKERSVVLVSHRSSTLKVANQIFSLQQGRLVKQDITLAGSHIKA